MVCRMIERGLARLEEGVLTIVNDKMRGMRVPGENAAAPSSPIVHAAVCHLVPSLVGDRFLASVWPLHHHGERQLDFQHNLPRPASFRAPPRFLRMCLSLIG